MKEGIITAVFDYAMGEIADGCFDALRAAGPDRLTTAGKLGLPQVICPGGSEHLGLLVSEPSKVPPGWEDHQITWHTPYVFVPRLNTEEQAKVANTIGERLQHSKSQTLFLMPLKGVSSYSAEGGELYNPELDSSYWQQLQQTLPKNIQIEALNYTAEDPAFVEYAVDSLINMIED
jgi:uncharacterized protein (UPF0261 family)